MEKELGTKTFSERVRESPLFFCVRHLPSEERRKIRRMRSEQQEF